MAEKEKRHPKDRREIPFQHDDLVRYHNLLAFVKSDTPKSAKIIQVYNATCFEAGNGHQMGEFVEEQFWPNNSYVSLFNLAALHSLPRVVTDLLLRKRV
jgi:hypothetical protein